MLVYLVVLQRYQMLKQLQLLRQFLEGVVPGLHHLAGREIQELNCIASLAM